MSTGRVVGAGAATPPPPTPFLLAGAGASASDWSCPVGPRASPGVEAPASWVRPEGVRSSLAESAGEGAVTGPGGLFVPLPAKAGRPAETGSTGAPGVGAAPAPAPARSAPTRGARVGAPIAPPSLPAPDPGAPAILAGGSALIATGPVPAPSVPCVTRRCSDTSPGATPVPAPGPLGADATTRSLGTDGPWTAGPAPSAAAPSAAPSAGRGAPPSTDSMFGRTRCGADATPPPPPEVEPAPAPAPDPAPVGPTPRATCCGETDGAPAVAARGAA